VSPGNGAQLPPELSELTELARLANEIGTADNDQPRYFNRVFNVEAYPELAEAQANLQRAPWRSIMQPPVRHPLDSAHQP
jgi:hypothetical protein